MTRTDRHRRRTTLVLAASLLVHVVLLGLLARSTATLYPVQVATRDFQVELVPLAPSARPLGQAERPGASAETAATVTPRAAKRPQRHTDIQTTTPFPLPARGGPIQPIRPPSPLSRPTPPPPPFIAPHVLTPGAPLFGQAGGLHGAPGGAQEGATSGSEGEGDDAGARVRGALRTSVGCDDPDYYNLSKAERAVCYRAAAVQAAIGAKQYVDPISSAKVRNKYEQDRETCERINHYATPLDSDREHSAHAPGSGFDRWRC